nr:EAL domain-containing protein [Woeseiaceae bacterium]
MNKPTNGIYIDPGSMSVFAGQILEALDDACGVAVHDAGQQRVWVSPGSRRASAWLVDTLSRTASAGNGVTVHGDAGRSAWVFDLQHASTKDRIGTISVLTESPNPMGVELVLLAIKPILRCIERQIDINAELSSVRRIPEEARQGMNLLVELDEIDQTADPQTAIRELLALTARHFGAKFSAVLLPGSRLQAVHPDPAGDDESKDRQLMSMLGSLMAKAKAHRKVTRTSNGRSNVLTTPIFDVKDEVVGVYVVAKRDEFSKEQIRLCRAIGAKTGALGSAPERTAAGPFSRHDFLRYVEEVIRRESSTPHAVLMVDIDKLHIVNDSFGHMAGDAVIRRVHRILQDITKHGDIVATLGGDAFGMFLRAADEQEVARRASFILQSVANEDIEHEGKITSVTTSIGVALIPDVVSDAESALSTAEVATRSAKGRGGNRHVVFRDLDASVMQRRSDLDQVGRLQAALLDDRFVLFAQPIKPLQTGETAPRYEILVRMLDEDGSVLPPGKFLSAAERYQMMGAIDRWVVRRTLDQLSAADNPLEIGLGSFSINVSAQSLMDKDFLPFLETQIAESGIPPDALCFEITETSIVRSLEMAQRFIARLRHLGCRVALDDFGTGYCSFAYLKDLHVHYVKVDGVFIRDILDNPLSEAIVVSLVRIADVMSAAVVAEYVETDLVIQR